MSSRAPSVQPSISFPALVQEFFTHYLVEQRALSPRTVAGYRDAFILFLTFAHQHLGTWPTALKLTDITSDTPISTKRDLLLAPIKHHTN